MAGWGALLVQIVVRSGLESKTACRAVFIIVITATILLVLQLIILCCRVSCQFAHRVIIAFHDLPIVPITCILLTLIL